MSRVEKSLCFCTRAVKSRRTLPDPLTLRKSSSGTRARETDFLPASSGRPIARLQITVLAQRYARFENASAGNRSGRCSMSGLMTRSYDALTSASSASLLATSGDACSSASSSCVQKSGISNSRGRSARYGAHSERAPAWLSASR
eukprot:Amastigsp_a341666_15.p4 type:complete len:145 gc:universal Amastigsp_a341666_15:572-1006(+)